MNESPPPESQPAPLPVHDGGVGPADRAVTAPSPFSSSEDVPKVGRAAQPTNVRQQERLGVRDVLMLCLTWLVAVPASRDEIRARAYSPQGTMPLHDVDRAQAEFLYKQQREDSAHTDDKVKQLLTLSASLTTAIVVFTRDVEPRWLVAAVMGLLIACVFLCLSVLDVRTAMMPTLEDVRCDDLESK
jgi:hypothetical protein